MPTLLPERAFWAEICTQLSEEANMDAKDMWDAKATGFAHKRTRSGYIDQLIGLLDLELGQSVFDMGAGPGTLSIPLAQRGHEVCAVDFSPRMLGELQAASQAAGVEVRAFERAWQDDWSGLPKADVAVASRSLITPDVEGAFAKLESKARSRVAVTMVAGETPMADLRMLEAVGRPRDVGELRQGFVAAVNLLFTLGRSPRIDYITYPRTLHAQTHESLLLAAEAMTRPVDEAERAALRAFVEEHTVPNGRDGGVMLDYEQAVTWGYIEWDVPPEASARA